MDIKIERSADGWITISSCGKSMNVRMTRDEFYSKDMNIKVISSEPNESNRYEKVEIGNATLSFDDKFKETRKDIQKRRKRNQRLNEIRREALANIVNYLSKNELISYQVRYQKADKHTEKWWDYVKHTDNRINRTVQGVLGKFLTNTDDGNSIDLSPKKRKDKIFINKDIVKEQAKIIEDILLSDGAEFKNNTGRVYYDDKKPLDTSIIEEIEKNGAYVTIEKGKYGTNSSWFFSLVK